MMNFEAFRAMYEGRNAKLFHPTTGVLTWMSNPSQPSFVWQLYSWDLEPNASLFATRRACEPVHVQMNETDGHVLVVNNTPRALSGRHGEDLRLQSRRQSRLHAYRHGHGGPQRGHGYGGRSPSPPRSPPSISSSWNCATPRA